MSLPTDVTSPSPPHPVAFPDHVIVNCLSCLPFRSPTFPLSCKLQAHNLKELEEHRDSLAAMTGESDPHSDE
ncbi:hypothetical protein P7K49_029928 [Saguinus oedipus]|uniref:Uncharacterized protein n=1 Tax=Saguinus oedipus TaxID=9490 RepID=A0ABQ9U9D9_SAGOE|nr:hypothetical protein P7K49_029928 [Saguinus oedipus]